MPPVENGQPSGLLIFVAGFLFFSVVIFFVKLPTWIQEARERRVDAPQRPRAVAALRPQAAPQPAAPRLKDVPEPVRLVPHAEWWPLLKEMPHIRCVGPSQSGKSVLAMAFASDTTGKLLIIDPVWRRGNWGGLPAITVAPDGDYAPIGAALKQIQDEFKTRGGKLQQEDDPSLEPLTIIWDEVPDTILECQQLAALIVRRLAQSGRHKAMKLVGMGITERVGAWGLQNYGDVGDSFLTIYFGTKAYDKLPALAGMAHPAVMEYRGQLLALDTAQLMRLAQRPIDPSRVWRLIDDDDAPEVEHPAEAIKRVTCTAEEVASFLIDNPGASRAAIERELFGFNGGAAYKAVTAVWGEALLLRELWSKEDATTAS